MFCGIVRGNFMSLVLKQNLDAQESKEITQGSCFLETLFIASNICYLLAVIYAGILKDFTEHAVGNSKFFICHTIKKLWEKRRDFK